MNRPLTSTDKLLIAFNILLTLCIAHAVYTDRRRGKSVRELHSLYSMPSYGNNVLTQQNLDALRILAKRLSDYYQTSYTINDTILVAVIATNDAMKTLPPTITGENEN